MDVTYIAQASEGEMLNRRSIELSPGNIATAGRKGPRGGRLNRPIPAHRKRELRGRDVYCETMACSLSRGEPSRRIDGLHVRAHRKYDRSLKSPTRFDVARSQSEVTKLQSIFNQ